MAATRRRPEWVELTPGSGRRVALYAGEAAAVLGIHQAPGVLFETERERRGHHAAPIRTLANAHGPAAATALPMTVFTTRAV
jgi:hypothetical protein